MIVLEDLEDIIKGKLHKVVQRAYLGMGDNPGGKPGENSAHVAYEN